MADGMAQHAEPAVVVPRLGALLALRASLRGADPASRDGAGWGGTTAVADETSSWWSIAGIGSGPRSQCERLRCPLTDLMDSGDTLEGV